MGSDLRMVKHLVYRVGIESVKTDIALVLPQIDIIARQYFKLVLVPFSKKTGTVGRSSSSILSKGADEMGFFEMGHIRILTGVPN